MPLPTHDTEIHTELPDKVTLDEAAVALGKTPTRIRQMIQAKNFKQVWELGGRPTYLLDKAEVQAMAEESEA